MSTITIKITAPAEELTGKYVRNTLRKAFEATGDDLLPDEGESKGVEFTIKHPKPRASKSPKVPTEASLIRAWAVEQGMHVGKRGRIHPKIKEAYTAREVN